MGSQPLAPSPLFGNTRRSYRICWPSSNCMPACGKAEYSEALAFFAKKYITMTAIQPANMNGVYSAASALVKNICTASQGAIRGSSTRAAIFMLLLFCPKPLCTPLFFISSARGSFILRRFPFCYEFIDSIVEFFNLLSHF